MLLANVYVGRGSRESRVLFEGVKVLEFLNTICCCPQQATQTQNLAREGFRVWTHLAYLDGHSFVGCYLLPFFIGKG